MISGFVPYTAAKISGPKSALQLIAFRITHHPIQVFHHGSTRVLFITKDHNLSLMRTNI